MRWEVESAFVNIIESRPFLDKIAGEKLFIMRCPKNPKLCSAYWLVGAVGIELSRVRGTLSDWSAWVGRDGIEPRTKEGTALDCSSRAHCRERRGGVGKLCPIAGIWRMGELPTAATGPKSRGGTASKITIGIQWDVRQRWEGQALISLAGVAPLLNSSFRRLSMPRRYCPAQIGDGVARHPVSLVCQYRKKALTRQCENREAEFWQTY